MLGGTSLRLVVRLFVRWSILISIMNVITYPNDKQQTFLSLGHILSSAKIMMLTKILLYLTVSQFHEL